MWLTLVVAPSKHYLLPFYLVRLVVSPFAIASSVFESGLLVFKIGRQRSFFNNLLQFFLVENIAAACFTTFLSCRNRKQYFPASMCLSPAKRVECLLRWADRESLCCFGCNNWIWSWLCHMVDCHVICSASHRLSMGHRVGRGWYTGPSRQLK